MNILIEKPYIAKCIAVVKNQMHQTPRNVVVNGRLSDAFVYILSGACTYYFEDGTQFTAECGDIIYLANRAFYKMKLETENYSFIYVDFLLASDQRYRSFVYKNTINNEYLSAFKKLYAEYKNLDTKITCMRRLYDIYATLCEQNKSQYVPQSLKERIEKCKEYIHAHYDDSDLTIARLSELAQMSEVYFRKIFQSIYKISPKKYIIKIRLNHSIQCMSYSFLSLEECARACGFSSLQYFCKVFKQEFGESPAFYRKNKLKKEHYGN